MTIERLTAGDPDTQSADIINDNLDRLRELFPEAFTEGRIDFDVLRQALGDAVEDGDERYGLNWRGKRAARRLALTPSTGTLRPAPDESVDWETTQNLMIEGDNLEVLKLLQKSYAGQVKLIYIDPPYNTGRDFVYPDDFRDSIRNYLEVSGQVGEGGRVRSNTETSGRFHTDWLNMMYARLLVARDLLSPEGVILISIDDHESANLQRLCAEVFGEDNFIISLVWEKGRKNDSTFFSETVEYIHVFARDRESLARLGPWREQKPGIDAILTYYQDLRQKHGENHDAIAEAMRRFYDGLDNDDPGKRLRHFWRSDSRGLFFGADISSASTSIPDYDVIHPITGKPCKKPSRGWGCNPDEMERRIADDRVLFGEDETTIPLKKSYLVEVDSIVKTPVFYKDGRGASLTLRNLLGPGVFDNPKDHYVLADLISYVAGTDALVLDFFAGSGSTAHAVWEQNGLDGGDRRFILVQLPEPLDPDVRDQQAAARFCDLLDVPRNLAEVTKERLRRTATKIRDEHPLLSGDLGFRVFKLDSSNIREWDPQPENLDTALELSVKNLKADRTEDDILYELLLKRGIELTVPIETRDIAKKAVHSIGAGTLFACLAERIERADAEPIALGIVAWRDELAPAGDIRVVFRDSAFVDDVAKTNLAEILRQHGLADVKSI